MMVRRQRLVCAGASLAFMRQATGLTALGALDWVAIGLLTAGLVFLASGLLPAADASATMGRILPILL
jgi:hypothetical protein